jgi:hypothetical protein
MPRSKVVHENEKAPQEDREWFLRDNAVAVVRDKDALICRLRHHIKKLEEAVRSLKALLRKERNP